MIDKRKLLEYKDKKYRHILGNLVSDISGKIVGILDVDLNYPSDIDSYDFKNKNKAQIRKYKKYFWCEFVLLLSDGRQVNIKVENLKIVFDNFEKLLNKKYGEDLIEKVKKFYDRLLRNSNVVIGYGGVPKKIENIETSKFGGNTSYEYLRRKFGL